MFQRYCSPCSQSHLTRSSWSPATARWRSVVLSGLSTVGSRRAGSSLLIASHPWTATLSSVTAFLNVRMARTRSVSVFVSATVERERKISDLVSCFAWSRSCLTFRIVVCLSLAFALLLATLAARRSAASFCSGGEVKRYTAISVIQYSIGDTPYGACVDTIAGRD